MNDMSIWEYLDKCLPNKTIQRVSDTLAHGLRIVFTDGTYLDINNVKTNSVNLTGFRQYKNYNHDPCLYHENWRKK